MKAYYKKNKRAMKCSVKQYYECNKEARKMKRKLHYDRNNDCAKVYYKNYYRYYKHSEISRVNLYKARTVKEALLRDTKLMKKLAVF